MKLLYLNYFCTVAELQSVSKAAKLLYVSQPTITYAIKELESEFQIKLFTRKRHGLSLTKEGTQFLRASIELLDHARAVEAKMHAIARNSSEINLGIPPMMSITFFPSINQYLHKRAPEISIRLYEAGANEICNKLSQGILDAGIVPKQFVNTDLFECLDLKRERYVCCVGKNHRLAGRRSVSIADLKDEPFVVLTPEYANYTFTTKVFEEHGFVPHIPLITTEFASVIDRVENAGFVSFVFRAYATRYQDRIVGIPLDIEPSYTDQIISMVWSKQRGLSDAMNKVLSSLDSEQFFNSIQNSSHRSLFDTSA